MSKKTRKPIKSLAQLRFKLAELWEDIDDHSVELSEANAKIKLADVLVKSIVAEGIKNKIEGVVRTIDFIDDEHEKTPLLIDEFAKAK